MAKGTTAPLTPGTLCPQQYPSRRCGACRRLARMTQAEMASGAPDADYLRELRRAAVLAHAAPDTDTDTPAPAAQYTSKRRRMI